MKRIVHMFLMAVLGVSSLLLIGQIDARVSGPPPHAPAAHAIAPQAGTGTSSLLTVR
jgi:hypothetical protein